MVTSYHEAPSKQDKKRFFSGLVSVVTKKELAAAGIPILTHAHTKARHNSKLHSGGIEPTKCDNTILS